jgi:hypothetical protein
VNHHKYNLNEIENMIPWERDIYVGMLSNHLKEQEEKLKLEQAAQQAKQRQANRKK